ncbi:MAG TPA: PIN domain-containing protein [Terriglobales bacterium]|nr:PIN domain-containing protein [Terriglobales bacterium]
MIVVCDTGALLALLDGDERQHAALLRLYRAHRAGWVLPAAILPEVDYLVAAHLGGRAQDAWLADLAQGAFSVDWGGDEDLARAGALQRQYRDLQMGLVDALVLACAERLGAGAIATLDLGHFGSVRLAGAPRLLPRDG